MMGEDICIVESLLHNHMILSLNSLGSILPNVFYNRLGLTNALNVRVGTQHMVQ